MDSEDRWPWLMSISGGLLGVLMVGEFLAYLGLRESVPADFIAGAITSGPFILLLGYGGVRLSRSDLPRSRYARIGLWVLGSMLVFLVMNAIVMLAIPPDGPLNFVGWLRWAVAVGGGIGFLMGFFQAKAIDREVAAERRRMRNEQLREQNEQLDEFASIVSHDLRNPLNVAQGHLELARQNADIPNHEQIAQSLDRMEQLIDDLLGLARAGQTTDELEEISLATVAEHSWGTVDTGEATLRVDTASHLRADRSRSQQLLENLFRNAIEHGGETVTVTVGDLDDGFYVADDGPGLPDTDKESLFGSGFTTAEDGTGLGLSIVQQIVEAHGWTITATESMDGGARFEITDVELVQPPARVAA